MGICCQNGKFSSTTNGIELESTKVNDLVLAAKQGKWENVFSILATYPHLINAIPEDRRWGVLHQAVWWNKQDNIKNLLKVDEMPPMITFYCEPEKKKILEHFTEIESHHSLYTS
jgi:hypothetical protein